LSGSELVKEQIQDSDIMLLRQRALPLEDASKEPECYYLKDDILMRKWRPPDALPSEEWRQAGVFIFRNGIASGKRVEVHIIVSKY
jgi:hypothetical protein